MREVVTEVVNPYGKCHHVVEQMSFLSFLPTHVDPVWWGLGYVFTLSPSLDSLKKGRSGRVLSTNQEKKINFNPPEKEIINKRRSGEQWKTPWLVRVIYGIILPRYIGIIVIHCKDPYRPTSIMESNQFFFCFRRSGDISICLQSWTTKILV